MRIVSLSPTCLDIHESDHYELYLIPQTIAELKLHTISLAEAIMVGILSSPTLRLPELTAVLCGV